MHSASQMTLAVANGKRASNAKGASA